jgi:hypothetical protein
VFNWPSDRKLSVPAWGKMINRAYLLTAPRTALKFTAGPDGIMVQLPVKAPDQIASVVVLETKD